MADRRDVLSGVPIDQFDQNAGMMAIIGLQ